MKFLVTSDLHGYLPDIRQEFDVLFICGDICPAYNHSKAFQDEWVKYDFVEWIKQLPFRSNSAKVIMVPGNHDFILEKWKQDEIDRIYMNTNGRLIILRNENYLYTTTDLDNGDYKTFKIFGTPYCSIFFNWAFMVNDETLREKFNRCSQNVDFFISHDSPNINKLGAILEGPYASETTGNKILPEIIEEKRPKYFFSGHFHSGNHNFEKLNEYTYASNVSFVNEDYNPVNPILYFEIDKDKKPINVKTIDCNVI